MAVVVHGHVAMTVDQLCTTRVTDYQHHNFDKTSDGKKTVFLSNMKKKRI